MPEVLKLQAICPSAATAMTPRPGRRALSGPAGPRWSTARLQRQGLQLDEGADLRGRRRGRMKYSPSPVPGDRGGPVRGIGAGARSAGCRPRGWRCRSNAAPWKVPATRFACRVAGPRRPRFALALPSCARAAWVSARDRDSPASRAGNRQALANELFSRARTAALDEEVAGVRALPDPRRPRRGVGAAAHQKDVGRRSIRRAGGGDQVPLHPHHPATAPASSVAPSS